jgi:type IV pilus assembly protein PilZ
MKIGAENKRKATRLQHEIPIAYRSVGSFLSDWATDISQGGLFINTRNPLPVGTEVRILIQLPGEPRAASIDARVTRVSEYDNHHNLLPGMAVEFTALGPERRAELDQFVQRLRGHLEAP